LNFRIPNHEHWLFKRCEPMINWLIDVHTSINESLLDWLVGQSTLIETYICMYTCPFVRKNICLCPTMCHLWWYKWKIFCIFNSAPIIKHHFISFWLSPFVDEWQQFLRHLFECFPNAYSIIGSAVRKRAISSLLWQPSLVPFTRFINWHIVRHNALTFTRSQKMWPQRVPHNPLKTNRLKNISYAVYLARIYKIAKRLSSYLELSIHGKYIRHFIVLANLHSPISSKSIPHYWYLDLNFGHNLI